MFNYPACYGSVENKDSGAIIGRRMYSGFSSSAAQLNTQNMLSPVYQMININVNI